MKRTLLGLLLFLLVFILTVGCSSKTEENFHHGIGNFQNANFASEKLLRSHYIKHVVKQKEFGNITIDEYLEGARKLINSKPGGNILTKTRSNGDILFYNQSTNEFAVVTKDGVIRTYFKPKEGIKYFKRQ
jgi:pyocin large subunit-like protein